MIEFQEAIKNKIIEEYKRGDKTTVIKLNHPKMSGADIYKNYYRPAQQRRVRILQSKNGRN